MQVIPCGPNRYRDGHQGVERAMRAVTASGHRLSATRAMLWRMNGGNAEIRTETETEFTSGQVVKFELDAVPERVRGAKPDRGVKRRRTYLFSENERIDWLEVRFRNYGIILGEVKITEFRDRIIARKDALLMKPGVRFTGTAMIHDPVKAKACLANGIGDYKAFGYGMLVIIE